MRCAVPTLRGRFQARGKTAEKLSENDKKCCKPKLILFEDEQTSSHRFLTSFFFFFSNS